MRYEKCIHWNRLAGIPKHRSLWRTFYTIQPQCPIDFRLEHMTLFHQKPRRKIILFTKPAKNSEAYYFTDLQMNRVGIRVDTLCWVHSIYVIVHCIIFIGVNSNSKMKIKFSHRINARCHRIFNFHQSEIF